MKAWKLALIAVLAMLAIVIAYLFGNHNGKMEAISESVYYIVDFDLPVEFNGNWFDTSLFIELDGNVYEQGLYIG